MSLKYRKVGATALILLFITGIAQLEYRGMQWSMAYMTESPYGKIAASKLLVFLGIVVISLVHDYYLGNRAIKAWRTQPNSPDTIKLRNISRLFGRISFTLALLAAWLGVVLVRGW